MKKQNHWILAIAVVLLVVGPAPGAAVTLGQVDDFQDGTVHGWFVGAPHPDPPVNVPSGGPGGEEDGYMLLTSVGGFGPGSRLVVLNRDQWAGDYLGAGVAVIKMRLLNLSDIDLDVRVRIADPTEQPPLNEVISPAARLPQGSGWTEVAYSIAPEDLIVLRGDPVAALTGASEMRIFHGTAPVFPPAEMAARLGVDAIEAASEETATASATWGWIRALYR